MKNISILILLLNLHYCLAQKKQENIGTEVVNVVKPYTPTIADAFKIKEIPTNLDDNSVTKQEIKYQIFSFPVASTFAPNKGKAATLDKIIPPKYYSNYATLAAGNYGNLYADIFLHHKINQKQYIATNLKHLSSAGKLKNIDLNNNFYQTAIAAIYNYAHQETTIKANAEYAQQLYNWYGLPIANPDFDSNTVSAISPKHLYNTIKTDAEIAIKNSVFEKLNLNYIYFSDNYQSAENNFLLQPSFLFKLQNNAIQTKFSLDYASTQFNTNYQLQIPTQDISVIKNNNLIISATPSYWVKNETTQLQVGINCTYFSKINQVFAGQLYGSSTKFLFYPEITITHSIIKDILQIFGTAQGGLKQNTYQALANKNNFLSPTLLLQPTNNLCNFTAGIKGKITNAIDYQLQAGYDVSNNMPLFKSNTYVMPAITNYSYGNSYTIVYDNVKTYTFNAGINTDINKNISFELSTQFNAYSQQTEKEAWNLPKIKATFASNLTMGKWHATTQLFYVGDRKDAFTTYSIKSDNNTLQTIQGYLDLNAQLNFNYNQHLTAFIKGNNLANQQYSQWLNYPVQGIQIMLGGTYKFDF